MSGAGFLSSQQAFAAALRDADGEATALGVLAGDAARNQALLGVYRGNALANAGKALSLAYPVVMQIVGDEFFEALGRAFWRVQPPVSGNLNAYGEGFAAFLADFPHVQDMPYLPDVARVEWCVHVAYGAANHVPATVDLLARIDPEQVANTCFALQAGLAVIESDWPVVSIWQQHQPDHTAPLDIDLDQAQLALVFRQGLRPQLAQLSHAEAAFWRRLASGQSLGTALEDAVDIDTDFDAGAVLQAGFARELILATLPL